MPTTYVCTYAAAADLSASIPPATLMLERGIPVSKIQHCFQSALRAYDLRICAGVFCQGLPLMSLDIACTVDIVDCSFSTLANKT